MNTVLHSNPEIGDRVNSGFESVTKFDPAVIDALGEYRSELGWFMGDTFTTSESGLVIPNQEVIGYQRKMGWGPLPNEEKFQTAYQVIRDTMINDASIEFGTRSLALMLQIKHSGEQPLPIDEYDRVPHLDFVALLGQRVFVYYLSNKATPKIFGGDYIFEGFLDDYSNSPDFQGLEEQNPDENELVRTEGIKTIHAPSEPEAGRVFIRGFAEIIS